MFQGVLDPAAGLAHHVGGRDGLHQRRPGGGGPQTRLHRLGPPVQVCQGEGRGILRVPGGQLIDENIETRKHICSHVQQKMFNQIRSEPEFISISQQCKKYHSPDISTYS